MAGHTGARLGSADAFQVYRGLDIGTAKPTEASRYELLDLVEPNEEFSVVQWLQAAQEVLSQAWRDNSDVVLVGGTGFYLRALLERYQDLGAAPEPALRESLMAEEQRDGLPALVTKLQELDPEAAATTDLANPVRVRRAIERALTEAPKIEVDLPPFRVLKVAVWPDDSWHAAAIANRVEAMWRSGWPDEVRVLVQAGVRPEAPGMRAIGYHTMVKHLEGLVTEEEAKESIVLATRQYAKRQKTWLRKEPRVEYLKLMTGEDDEFALTVEDVCLRLESLEST